MLENCINTFAELDKNQVTDEVVWNDAIKRFSNALKDENQRSNLESSVIDKRSWYLPIECKLNLLNKAKAAGCNSFEFWKDYYGYRATYLEPDDPERPFALEMASIYDFATFGSSFIAVVRRHAVLSFEWKHGLCCVFGHIRNHILPN